MSKIILPPLLLFVVLICSCEQTENQSLNYKTHVFYYSWYGNPQHDGGYLHWNHAVLPHWSDSTWDNAGSFPGKEDIGANFYPKLGCYSSNDTSIIRQHMEMLQRAGIGVLAFSWWGKNSYEDKSLTTYLEIAHSYGVKITMHIEPFYNSAEELKTQLDYLATKYSDHPALFLYNNKPFYYMYDSYKLKVDAWKKLLHPGGELSVRDNSSDATFIGLWVHKDEEDFFKHSGFDGFYTYFASDGFVYGSTSTNWQMLSEIADKNELLFVPCAGPGYKDTRIRPWNEENTKQRNKGRYYEDMFRAAIEAQPDFIGITSFNEWHEGTQIEPAVPKSINGYTYKDYGTNASPFFYLDKTKELIEEFK